MKKIKLITLLPLMATCLSVTGCFNEKGAKTFKFTNLASDFYISTKRMKLYFPDEGNLPYVDLTKFISDLNGYIYKDIINIEKNESRSQLTMSIPILLTQSPVVVFDWDRDVVSADQLFFEIIPLTSATTDYSAHFKTVEEKSSVSNPEKVIYNLRSYNFDIKYENGKVLLPLVIANMLFCSPNYYNIYFNGDALYGVFGETRDESIINRICRSSWNGKECPQDVAFATKNSLLFATDYFYGLQEDKGFKHSKLFYVYNDLNKLASPRGKDHVDGINKLIYNQINDLHSRVDFYTPYHDVIPDNSYLLTDRGDRWGKFYSRRSELLNYRNNYLGQEFEPVRFSGDTAIITFDSFEIGDVYSLKRKDAWKYDTFELFKYCMDKIGKHGGINDVLVDLTLNGGGNIAAMINALGFITDDEIYYNIKDTLTNSTTRAAFIVDTDGDGTYTNDAYSNYRWTVLASTGTFSAANLFTSVFQNQGLGKVIGNKSSGGMCGVQPLVLADGTAFTLSGNMTFRKYNNGNFESIEYGVEPDVEMSYNDLYNDEKLVAAIDAAYN